MSVAPEDANRTREYSWQMTLSTALIGIGVVAGSAAAGQGSQLPGFVLHEIQAVTGDRELGKVVIALPDLDGDTVPDFAASDPESSSGCSECGRVFVYSGQSGSLIFSVNGTESGATHSSPRFGQSLCASEDINGDGVPEIVVGAPGDVQDKGAVFVLSGVDGAVLLKIDGEKEAEFEGIGEQCRVMPDVNGDGYPELVTTALFDYALVISLNPAEPAVLFDTDVDLAENLETGSIDVIGDLNGDGYPELGLGFPWESPFGIQSAGRAVVLSGLDWSVIREWSGSQANTNLGSGLSGIPDFSGDGVSEVVVGSGFVSIGGSVSLRVYSGSSGLLLSYLGGAGPRSSSAGDLDGDGVPELMTAHSFAFSGQGPQPSQVRFVSASDGVIKYMTPGPVYNSFDLCGDLNEDGFPEFVLGYSEVTQPGGGKGAVTVASYAGIPIDGAVFGTACTGSLSTPPIATTIGGSPSTQGNPGFGVAVADVPAPSVALLQIGLSHLQWLGVPLPLDLGPFGLPGCAVYVSGDLIQAVATTLSPGGIGIGRVALPIPADQSISGAILHFQWLALDTSFALDAMSDAIQVLIL